MPISLVTTPRYCVLDPRFAHCAPAPSLFRWSSDLRLKGTGRAVGTWSYVRDGGGGRKEQSVRLRTTLLVLSFAPVFLAADAVEAQPKKGRPAETALPLERP